MVEHPQDKKVTRADGKSVGALSKDVYMAVLQSTDENGIPLSQYLESQEDVKDAINGGIFYHGTRLLGQAVKNSLRSAAGPVGSHEGVVLRGMEDFLVKLTGDFIVQGLASTHGKQEEMLKEDPLDWTNNLSYTESIMVEQTEGSKETIAIYPGRFQPMGRHHFQTFQKIVGKYGLQNTFITTSDKTGKNSPLNFKEKKDIMMMHGIPESQIVQTKNPYAAAELLKSFNPEDTAAVYLVGAKDMAEDPRFQNLDGVKKNGEPAHLKTLRDDEELLGFNKHSYVGVAPHVKIAVPGFEEMSGTVLRQVLKDATPEEFKTIMGWFNQEIYDILQGKLEEMSGSGAVAGYSGNAFRHIEDDDDKKNEQLVNEVMNYLLGITVG